MMELLLCHSTFWMLIQTQPELKFVLLKRFWLEKTILWVIYLQIKRFFNFIIEIKYWAPINQYGDAGLYYSSYYNDEGDIKYLVGTFFEPMRARKMIPSFDDPFFKATYQLSVIYPTKAKIYSNTEKAPTSRGFKYKLIIEKLI